MDLKLAICSLATQGEAIYALAADVSAEQARWKPTPQTWSLLEVVNHLYDEEREDFRAHFQGVLSVPEQPWASIDPQGWISARAYNTRDLAASLANFKAERAASLDWLRSLPGYDAGDYFEAPWGLMCAGDLLASWVAHDLLHIRQLNELRYAWLAARMVHGLNSLRYAGDW